MAFDEAEPTESSIPRADRLIQATAAFDEAAMVMEAVAGIYDACFDDYATAVEASLPGSVIILSGRLMNETDYSPVAYGGKPQQKNNAREVENMEAVVVDVRVSPPGGNRHRRPPFHNPGEAHMWANLLTHDDMGRENRVAVWLHTTEWQLKPQRDERETV